MAICILWGGPVAAQQVIADFYTGLGPVDMFNSSGKRLTRIADILQQDRANFHRFGRREDGDGYDPIFADRAARARIPELYNRGPGSEPYLEQFLNDGISLFVRVTVYGTNGMPTFLVISEGAG
ncbi:MAG: hypothetical protein JXR75_10660 [Rhodobacteraceae bacterium]|nr:hypothetical protein [Paracoccaceae bacterium]